VVDLSIMDYFMELCRLENVNIFYQLLIGVCLNAILKNGNENTFMDLLLDFIIKKIQSTNQLVVDFGKFVSITKF